MRLLIVLSLLFVSACSYKPIVDTGGRSGTFSIDRASKITDDTNQCHLEIEKHVWGFFGGWGSEIVSAY